MSMRQGSERLSQGPRSMRQGTEKCDNLYLLDTWPHKMIVSSCSQSWKNVINRITIPTWTTKAVYAEHMFIAYRKNEESKHNGRRYFQLSGFCNAKCWIRASHKGLGHQASFSMVETILKSYFTDLGVRVTKKGAYRTKRAF
jgi:hypothetical protein